MDLADWLGWRRPALVDCTRPTCRAARGNPCTTGTGFTSRFHDPRREAADQLTDAQVYMIAAEIEAAERQRPAREPLSDEVAETRRRTAAAWTEICRETAAEERNARRTR